MKIKSTIFAIFLSLSLIASQAIAYQPINPNGQALAANSQPVTLAPGTTVLSSTITRPGNATQYAVGQMVANSATPGSVTPFSWAIAPGNGIPVYILGGTFYIQSSVNAGVSPVSGSFRVHLYSVTPTVNASSGDGLTYKTTMVNWCGSLDGTLLLQGTEWTTATLTPTPGQGAFVSCTPAGGSSTIFGLTEARDTFTPPNAGIIQVGLTRQ